ncbi:F-box domain containing protein [Tanacetum coccineum]
MLQSTRRLVFNPNQTNSFVSFHNTIVPKHDNAACLLEVKKNSFLEFKCCKQSSEYHLHVVLGSCNGLFYLSQDQCDKFNSLVVINPLRKECFELPPMDKKPDWRLSYEESCGLGFDYSTNTFKMVCVFPRVIIDVGKENIDLIRKNLCTMVHVLGTNLWQEVPQVPSYPINGKSVFAHGCIHWLVTHFLREAKHGRKVICFDVRKEKFRVIKCPPKKTQYNSVLFDKLVDLHGEVGYVYDNVDNCMEVWVLKRKEWVMHCRIHKKPLPIGIEVWGRETKKEACRNGTSVERSARGAFTSRGINGVCEKLNCWPGERLRFSSLYVSK